MRYANSLFLIAVFCFPLALLGQQATATLTGQVTDPAEAVVVGADVTVVNTATGTRNTTKTDSGGFYSIRSLNPGTSYTLQVTAPGFKSFTSSGLVLHVGETVRVDTRLVIGDVAETVEVSAAALQVQTERTDLSDTVTGRQVQAMPVNGSNFTTLLTLVPGASGNLPDFNAPVPVNSSQVVGFNGARQQHNRFLIDGVENNDRGCGGCITVLPNKETFEEFTVTTAASGSDIGQGSGGTVSIGIKSGTSQYHGALYEFFRNDKLDANNFFVNRAGQQKPELRFNNWGWQLGGPVPGSRWIREHAFFFFDEDWNRLRQGTTFFSNAVSPAQAGGDFSSLLTGKKDANGNDSGAIFVPNPIDQAQAARFAAAGLTSGQPFAGNIIPRAAIDPNALLLGASADGPLPLANTPGNKFTASPSVPTETRTETFRGDLILSDKLRLMGHFINAAVNQQVPTSLWTNSSYPTIGTQFVNPSKSAIVKATWTMDPSTVSEISFGWDGNRIALTPTGNFQAPAGLGSAVGSIFPGNNLSRRPGIQFTGSTLGTALDVGSWPWANSNDNYQAQYQLSKVYRTHTLTFGFLGMLSNKNQVSFGNTQGLFQFNGSATAAPGSPSGGSKGIDYADFLLGNAFQYSELALQDKGHWRWQAYSTWFNDSWHVNKRLTLQLGMRWEFIPHVYELFDRQSNFLPDKFDPSIAQTPDPVTGRLDPNGPGFTIPPPPPQSGLSLVLPGFKTYTNGVFVAGNGISRGLVDNFFDTIAPRIGIAYKIRDDLVFRAGYGTFFERTQGNDVYNGAANAPFSFNTTFFNVPLTGTGGTGTTIPIFPASLTALDKKYIIPYTTSVNGTLEYQLNPKILIRAAYVGTFGRDLRIQRNINQPFDNNPLRGVLTPNLIRPFPGFANITFGENSVSSSYHSGQLELRTSGWRGLTLGLAYTYSHSIGFGAGGGTTDFGTIVDAYNLAAERGNTDLDRRHVLVINHVYELPFFKNSNSRWERGLLGGWQYSGITTIETGRPLNITAPGDPAGIGSGVRANCLAVSSDGPGTIEQFFNTAAFAGVDKVGVNGSSGFGNCGVNTVRGPGRVKFDMSFGKTFSGIPLPGTSDGGSVEIRGEFFNIFNHTQKNGVNTSVGNSLFGQVTSVFDPRVIQFSARFRF